MTDLFIIHGWTYRPEPWLEVIDKLQKQHKVKAELLRVPGLGVKSDRVFTIDDYVAWARKQLPKGAIALGHSNGGRILLNLSSKDSQHLSGMILLDAAGVYEKSLKRDISRILSRIFAPLKHIAPLRKIVHRLLGANDYEAAPPNMRKTLDNMLTSDRNLDLSQITTPTSIIWGDDDQITPLRQGRKMHAALKNSTLTIKKGWRHARYLVSTDDLAAEIAKQYKKLKERSHV